jgi:hypothetical protein
MGFRSTRESALDEITPYLPPGAVAIRPQVVDKLYSIVAPIGQPNSRTKRFQLVYSDAVPVARTLNFAEALQQLAADISVHTAFLAPKDVFVHAGVVAWRNRAIVLPGAAHIGKTTLVAALVRAGATYYSDEWAVLTPDGRVRPYARPLGVRGVNGDPDSSVPVQTLGGRAGTKAVPVELVVMTSFDPSAAWAPRRLTTAEATVAALQYTLQTRLRPAKVLPAVSGMMAGATILQGLRGDADVVAPMLLEMLESAGRARPRTAKRSH